ncbi:MAG: hypothetical protein ACRDN9_19055 [Streptosporangiaceae bacterium]
MNGPARDDPLRAAGRGLPRVNPHHAARPPFAYYGGKQTIASGTAQGGTWNHRTEVLWSNRPLRRQLAMFDEEPTHV